MNYVRWFGLLVLLSVVGLGLWLWNPLPANPTPEELALGASEYDVEILRDSWGVPHIFGKRDADAAFGLAYAHAEDDFQTIQTTVAAVRGVLARYQGVEAAVTDYLVSLFGV